MKKFFAFTLCVILGFSLVYGVITLAKNWSSFFSSSIENPVKPPDEDITPPLKKEEITDFKFSENSMVAYLGDLTTIENIPTSYSSEFISSSEEMTFNSVSDLESIFNESFDFTSYFKITFNDETSGYYDMNSFGYMIEEKGEALFPLKMVVGKLKFFEGNDYAIDSISGFAFDGTNVDTLILQEHITSFDLSNFSHIKKLVVNNESMVIAGPDFNSGNVPYVDFEMYVPDSIYEQYKSDEAWSKYSKYIFPSSYLNQGSHEYKEITDFKFTNGEIDTYLGSDVTLENIPLSYSVNFVPTSEEIVVTNMEEFSSFVDTNISDWTKYFKVVFQNGFSGYYSFNSFLIYMQSQGIEEIVDPITFQLGDVKFVEGNDYQVNSIGAFAFEGSNVNKLILPKHITNVDISIFDEIDELVIENESMINFIDVQEREDVGNTKIYVQSNLIEKYKIAYPNFSYKFFELLA